MLAGLSALLACPGLLALRAPWTARLPLSLAFWPLTWWWLPADRWRVLVGGLVLGCFLGAIGLLRLGQGFPGRIGVALVLSLLLPLVPWTATEAGPSPGAAERAIAAHVLASSGRPVASLQPLAPDPPPCDALVPALAADLVRLTGVRPHRASWLVESAVWGLLPMALYPLLARQMPGAGALALALGLAWLTAAFGGPPPAAAELGLVAGGLLVEIRSGPRVAAAAFLLAGASLASLAAALLGLLVVLISIARAGESLRRRLHLAAALGGVTLLFALPWLVRQHRLERPAPQDMLLLVPLLAPMLGRTPWLATLRAGVLALGALAGIFRGTLTVLNPVLPPDQTAALTWLRDHTGPLEAVCGDGSASARFLPAVAGRPLAEASCRLSFEAAAGPEAGDVVFRAGRAVVRKRPLRAHRFTAAAGTPTGP